MTPKQMQASPHKRKDAPFPLVEVIEPPLAVLLLHTTVGAPPGGPYRPSNREAFSCLLYLRDIAQASRDTLQNEVSYRYVCVDESTHRAVLGGALSPLRRYRAIWGVSLR